jgi:hypothetical protein
MGSISIEVSDGALGILPPNTDSANVKVGVCSSGTALELYSFSDIKTLRETLGEGPLVEAAAHALSVAGGPVYCMRVTPSTAGAAGSVTKSNGSAPNVSVAGAAYDSYSVRIRITKTGILGAGKCRISLDGGENELEEIVIPGGGTYAIPRTNLTLTFASGTYTAADTFTFATTQPLYTESEMTAAVAALLADSREWAFVHFVNLPADGPKTEDFAGQASTDMTTAEGAARFAFAVLDCGPDSDADMLSAFASFSSPRVMVAAGEVMLRSSIYARVLSRPAAWVVAARLAAIAPSESPGYVGRGALPSVSELVRDERVTSGLEDARFTVLQTYVGLAGAYVADGRMMAASGSDFGTVQNRRVIDKASKIARAALLPFINSSVRVNADGTILEEDAIRIESRVEAQLRAGIVAPGDATRASAQVNRATDVLATSELNVTVRVRPLGYAKDITVDIGFEANAS